MSGQWPPEWEDSDTGLPDEWTDSDAGLEPEASEVTLFLASVPSPVLPSSFEARISAAIAAEATARADGTASARTELAGTELAGIELAGTVSADAGIAVAGTDDAKTTDRSSSQEVSPAAAESGSATAARHRRRRTSAASRSAAAKSRPAGSRPNGRRRRFRLPSSGVGATLLVFLVIAGFAAIFTQIGGSSATYSGSVSSGTSASSPGASSRHAAAAGPANGSVPEYEGGDTSGPSDQFTVTESGVRYQGSTLALQVRKQLTLFAPNNATTPASSSVPSAASSEVEASSSASAPAASPPPPGLRGCVSHLTKGVTPTLVDRATYDGIPAYIIATSSRVWVVRPDCTAADPHQITSASLSG